MSDNSYFPPGGPELSQAQIDQASKGANTPTKRSAGRPAKDSFKIIKEMCKKFPCLTFSDGKYEYYNDVERRWLLVEGEKETLNYTGLKNTCIMGTLKTVCQEKHLDPNTILYKVIESEDLDPRKRQIVDVTPKGNQLHFTDGVLTIDPKTGEHSFVEHELNAPVHGPSISMGYFEVMNAPDSPKLMAVIDKQFPTPFVRDYVQRWVGTWLAPHVPCREHFLILGPTKCGKSSFAVALMTSVMGPEGVSQYTEYALATNHFMPANLKGRVGNISHDTEYSPKIVPFINGYNGQTFSVEVKGQQSYNARATAKLVATQNALKHEDYHGAYDGRIVPIFFSEQYSEDASYDRHAPMNWDFWKSERAGILKWMLKGYCNYIQHGAPQSPVEWSQLVRDKINCGNIHAEWLRNNIVSTDDLTQKIKYSEIEKRITGEVTEKISPRNLGTLIAHLYKPSKKHVIVQGIRFLEYSGLKFIS